MKKYTNRLTALFAALTLGVSLPGASVWAEPAGVAYEETANPYADENADEESLEKTDDIVDIEADDASVSEEEETELTLDVTEDSVTDAAMGVRNARTSKVVNPRYADIISEADLSLPVVSHSPIAALDLEEEPPVFADAEAASAYLRGQMVGRVEQVTFSLEMTGVDGWEMGDEIFRMALTHTGNPTEGDYLAWQYGGYGLDTGMTGGDGVFIFTYSFAISYFTGKAEEDAVSAAVQSLLGSLDLAGKTDYQKLSAVYEQLVKNTTYDFDRLIEDDDKRIYTAYGALVEHACVCQGYANAIYRLALEMGIDSRIIISFTINHSWNIVKLGDLYYYLDATRDGDIYRDTNQYQKKYFLKGSWDFADHENNDDNYHEAAFSTAYPLAETAYLPTAEEEPGQTIEEPEIIWSVTEDGFVEISYSSEVVYKSLSFAVWSLENGQDDLTWNDAESEDSRSFVCRFPVLNLKDYGEVAIHAYTEGSVFIHKTVVDVGQPSVGKIEVKDIDLKKGTCRLVLSDLAHPELKGGLAVAIWSESRQGDLKWYYAKPAGGSWDCDSVVDLDIANHKMNRGIYHARVYVEYESGKMVYQRKCDVDLSEPEPVAGGISLGDIADSGLVPIRVNSVASSAAGEIMELRAAVWSLANGQDDLQWYAGSASIETETHGGRVSGTVQADLKKHREDGPYRVHVYGLTYSGKMIFLGKTEDLVADASGRIRVTTKDVSADEGAFSVRVTFPGWSVPVSYVEVPVWCSTDQSDIKWYKAEKIAEGIYEVRVKAQNHQNHTGTYQVHVYATYFDKRFVFVGKTSQELTIPTVTIRDAGDGKRKVEIRGYGDAASVSVPTWSLTNGQDDLVWYPAVKGSNGVWTATIDAANHRNAGEFAVHVYADGAFAGKSSFVLAYGEVKTEWTDLAGKMQAARENQQLILVAASGTSAQVTMLNKNADGTWFQLLTSAGFVGRNGIGPTTEWSGTTPTGVYGFTKAFGIYEDPGTAFDYVKVDSSYYWVDDVNSRYYNKFVTTKTTTPDWSSAEHIIDYKGSYNYCLAIDYNPECTPGVGSAIFLHCSMDRATGGCVAVPESVMKKILQMVRTDCKIVIDTKSGLAAY